MKSFYRATINHSLYIIAILILIITIVSCKDDSRLEIGQPLPTFSIYGTIEDIYHQPISGVQVSVYPILEPDFYKAVNLPDFTLALSKLKGAKNAISNGNGYYKISNLLTMPYIVVASHVEAGYNPRIIGLSADKNPRTTLDNYWLKQNDRSIVVQDFKDRRLDFSMAGALLQPTTQGDPSSDEATSITQTIPEETEPKPVVVVAENNSALLTVSGDINGAGSPITLLVNDAYSVLLQPGEFAIEVQPKVALDNSRYIKLDFLSFGDSQKCDFLSDSVPTQQIRIALAENEQPLLDIQINCQQSDTEYLPLSGIIKGLPETQVLNLAIKLDEKDAKLISQSIAAPANEDRFFSYMLPSGAGFTLSSQPIDGYGCRFFISDEQHEFYQTLEEPKAETEPETVSGSITISETVSEDGTASGNVTVTKKSQEARAEDVQSEPEPTQTEDQIDQGAVFQAIMPSKGLVADDGEASQFFGVLCLPENNDQWSIKYNLGGGPLDEDLAYDATILGSQLDNHINRYLHLFAQHDAAVNKLVTLLFEFKWRQQDDFMSHEHFAKADGQGNVHIGPLYAIQGGIARYSLRLSYMDSESQQERILQTSALTIDDSANLSKQAYAIMMTYDKGYVLSRHNSTFQVNLAQALDMDLSLRNQSDQSLISWQQIGQPEFDWAWLSQDNWWGYGPEMILVSSGEQSALTKYDLVIYPAYLAQGILNKDETIKTRISIVSSQGWQEFIEEEFTGSGNDIRQITLHTDGISLHPVLSQ